MFWVRRATPCGVTDASRNSGPTYCASDSALLVLQVADGSLNPKLDHGLQSIRVLILRLPNGCHDLQIPIAVEVTALFCGSLGT